jgi:signal transduction histidine kinase
VLVRARTFRIEEAVIAVASVSIVALALLLVRDAIMQTEGTLRSAAQQETLAAAEELKTQYEERAVFSERTLQGLPLEAQDLSLRGLSQTVLRSYKEVRGGFLIAGSILGVASGREAIGSDESPAIELAVRSAKEANPATPVSVEAGRDLIVASAVQTLDRNFAWALRRLVGVRDPVPNRRRWLLATIVVAAVAGVAGVISISRRLRRGVDGIKKTLQQLESDFTFRPVPAAADFGEIHHAIARMADRRMELETTLRRQDRLAALGKVVAGVAHEIRNPLNSIRLQLEVLKRKTQKGIASADEVDAATREVDRLNTILGQLLGFGKPEIANRGVHSLHSLAQRASTMTRDRALAKGIEIQIAGDDKDGSEVNVDALQIEQVLINLLLNAIEAAPDNSVVSVEILKAGDSVELRVSDRGPGIPESIRDHIFDAFFTTRAEGTGLGLSVSREIVVAHGGSLEFTTSPAGTVFIVRLPSGIN